MSSIVPPTFSLRRVSECDFKAKCGLIIKVSANERLADASSRCLTADAWLKFHNAKVIVRPPGKRKT